MTIVTIVTMSSVTMTSVTMTSIMTSSHSSISISIIHRYSNWYLISNSKSKR